MSEWPSRSYLGRRGGEYCAGIFLPHAETASGRRTTRRSSISDRLINLFSGSTRSSHKMGAIVQLWTSINGPPSRSDFPRQREHFWFPAFAASSLRSSIASARRGRRSPSRLRLWDRAQLVMLRRYGRDRDRSDDDRASSRGRAASRRRPRVGDLTPLRIRPLRSRHVVRRNLLAEDADERRPSPRCFGARPNGHLIVNVAALDTLRGNHWSCRGDRDGGRGRRLRERTPLLRDRATDLHERDDPAARRGRPVLQRVSGHQGRGRNLGPGRARQRRAERALAVQPPPSGSSTCPSAARSSRSPGNCDASPSQFVLIRLELGSWDFGSWELCGWKLTGDSFHRHRINPERQMALIRSSPRACGENHSSLSSKTRPPDAVSAAFGSTICCVKSVAGENFAS